MKRITYLAAAVLFTCFCLLNSAIDAQEYIDDSTLDTPNESLNPESPNFPQLDNHSGPSQGMPVDTLFGPLHPPVEVIQFQDDPYNHNMGIASDGMYYYTVNGGQTTQGKINVYDLSGNFVSTNPIQLDMRGIVYNRSDGYFYVSTYNNSAVYKILSVSAGTFQILHSNILMNSQSSIGISWDGNYFFDHYNGTVNKHNFWTGAVVQTFTGFSYGAGNFGGNSTVTADPDYLYTWNAVTRQLFIYSITTGAPVEQYTLSNGDCGMSLSFIDGKIFVSNDGNYNIGTWFGFSIRDLEAQDISVSLTPVGLPIQIPASGGQFAFNIEVANNETGPVTFQVWTMATLPLGSTYGPIINTFVTMNGLSSGDRDRTQAVPANAPSGNYTYDAYVGIFPTSPWDEDHFEFSKSVTDNGGSIVNEWLNWGENFGDEIIEPAEIIPVSEVCMSAFPNPFNPTTTLSYTLPEAGNVILSVFDVNGREVSVLVDGMKQAGSNSITLDAGNLTSGVYFACLKFGTFTETRKILLMK